MKPASCVLITIGDELLIGQTIDTNSAWLGRQLNPMGIAVKRRIAVGDVADDIRSVLDEARAMADLIIITGGLGPTSDDITKPLLCDYFGTTLREDPKVLAHVTQFFARRNRPMLDSNRRQALVPATCEVLFNEMGTAPGMLFRDKGTMFISLPGVPFEMQHIMEQEGFNKIREAFHSTPLLHRSLLTSGEGESFLAERLKSFEAALPASVKLAYLPSLSQVKLRLTATAEAEQELMHSFSDLKTRVADILVGEGDIEPEEIVADMLASSRQWLGLAESCTGGLLASRLTAIKGASQWFRGSLVTYTDFAKEHALGVSAETLRQHTAVSEEAVREMAQQARIKLGSNFALSVSGYLEKNDHGNEVWIGLSSSAKTETHRFIAPYDRKKNAVLVCNTALNMLRKFILSH